MVPDLPESILNYSWTQGNTVKIVFYVEKNKIST